jgi:hypothetical protein
MSECTSFSDMPVKAELDLDTLRNSGKYSRLRCRGPFPRVGGRQPLQTASHSSEDIQVAPAR